MPAGDISYTYQIARVDEDGTEQPLEQHPISDTNLYIFSIRGTEDWETAERYLVDQFTASTWEPGRYAVQVATRSKTTGERTLVRVERLLPLHRAYARLPYHREPAYRPQLPIRAFIHTLVKVYRGSTMEQIAEHVDDFEAHYKATLSTPDLVARTGYTLPPDWVRPLSPYSEYEHPDEIPAHLA